MARIRTIKPEFQNSQSMGRVSREARLTFILLWPQCDDAGRIRADSRMLASVLYPYDDDAKNMIDGWLSELEKEECITRYCVGRDEYLAITHWNHQKIDHASPSRLPPPPEKKKTKSTRKSREDDANDREVSPAARALSSTVSSTVSVSNAREVEFESFWQAYPRKVGKGAARKAFEKAREQTEAEPIVEAALAYSSKRAGQEERYTAHPATWLNQERWTDEAGGSVVAMFQSADEQGWRFRLCKWDEQGSPGWNPKWGPPPTDQGCKCWPGLLDEWRQSEPAKRTAGVAQ